MKPVSNLGYGSQDGSSECEGGAAVLGLQVIGKSQNLSSNLKASFNLQYGLKHETPNRFSLPAHCLKHVAEVQHGV
jgi:hypothetical protein